MLLLYVFGLITNEINHSITAYVLIFIVGGFLWWIHIFDFKNNGIRLKLPVIYPHDIIPKDAILLGMFSWIGITIGMGIIFAFDFTLIDITLLPAFIGTSIISIRCLLLFLPDGILILKRK